MPRESLLEYFQPDFRPAREIAFAWRRGYRMVRWSYDDLSRAAAHFATELSSRGVSKGDRVLLWGENSGEWVAAFLACLFCGAVAVPMDTAAEPGFARRVAQQAGVRIAFVERSLPPLNLPLPTIYLEDLSGPASFPARQTFSFAQMSRDDPVEIVFTSGTTAEPRGVVLTHGNLLANLAPIEKEIERFRRYERIFHPLRFLDLLPLSHVFGQMLGIFIPQILGATSVFLNTLNPSEVVRAIHNERVSALISVPRLIESLKDQIERDLASAGKIEKFQRDLEATEGERFWKRWWRFRGVHRRLGWKFWAIISGGATLPAQTETFWTKLGYAVIQGYGLTETTSLVSVNHPFRLGRGSIGKAITGMEVKLAEDGEILVRGQNVASGYWKDARIAPVVDEDGWFHTGDLGERDASGNFYFKGRSKNVIVTPEGLNVYPGDLEAELRKETGVRDCVVVALDRDGNAEPCAVLLLRDSSSPGDGPAAEIVASANHRLAPFQQIRRWIVWPGNDFSRTPTQKPQLAAIKRAAETQLNLPAVQSGVTPPASTSLQGILARITGGQPVNESASAKLQLSSIERVELLSALEDRYQVDLGETEFADAQTVGAIERLLSQPDAHAPLYHYPRWAQSWPVRIFRALVFNLLARPAMLFLGWPRISGRENVRGVNGPVLVIANHIAFFDPAYVLEALPRRFRNKLAVAMDGELLESMRNPPPGTPLPKALADRAAYWLIVSIYNVFPLPSRAGFRKSFAFAGDLVDRGWNVLVFPEGVRTRDGKLSPFRAGIGLLAARLRVPVVPVRFDGIFELKAAGKKWAHPGQIGVAIGPPVSFRESDPPEEIAQDLQRRVTALGGESPKNGRKN
jgi:long-chain acyl-CoA synthetase